MSSNKYTVFLSDLDNINHFVEHRKAETAGKAADDATRVVESNEAISVRAMFVTHGWVNNLLGLGNKPVSDQADTNKTPTSKYLCETCRDFVRHGRSERVDCIGEHGDWKAEVDSVLSLSSHEEIGSVDTGTCDICRAHDVPRFEFSERNRVRHSSKQEAAR